MTIDEFYDTHNAKQILTKILEALATNYITELKACSEALHPQLHDEALTELLTVINEGHAILMQSIRN